MSSLAGIQKGLFSNPRSITSAFKSVVKSGQKRVSSPEFKAEREAGLAETRRIKQATKHNPLGTVGRGLRQKRRDTLSNYSVLG